MKSLFIVDGYNVIRRIDILRAKFNVSAEKGREALVIQLANWRHHSKSDVVVVFDGDSSSSVDSKSGIRIVFSKSHHSADDVIKKLVDNDKSRFAMTVVSSDTAVTRYAKSSGCAVMSSEAFHKKVSDVRNSEVEESEEKNDPQLSSKEIAQWLDMFNKK
jgi:predicted RNA-binding protein with PIN domain